MPGSFRCQGSNDFVAANNAGDLSGKTLASASSTDPKLKGTFEKEVRGGNIKGAEAIGKAIAERSIDKGIKRVVFDRGGSLYHGRIRAVADAARKAGLEF